MKWNLLYVDIKPYYDDGIELLENFLKTANAMYYGEYKEDFNKMLAIQEAIEGEYDYLILDNLS